MKNQEDKRLIADTEELLAKIVDYLKLIMFVSLGILISSLAITYMVITAISLN